MTSRSLMMLRSALREPERFAGRSTGDQHLDGLLRGWSKDERHALKSHELNGTLSQAMNEMFLGKSYSPNLVRQHAILGPFAANLSDTDLDSIKALMTTKGHCQEDVPPPSE